MSSKDSPVFASKSFFLLFKQRPPAFYRITNVISVSHTSLFIASLCCTCCDYCYMGGRVFHLSTFSVDKWWLDCTIFGKAVVPLIFLSTLLRESVLDFDNRRIGSVRDICVSLDETFPVITALVAST